MRGMLPGMRSAALACFLAASVDGACNGRRDRRDPSSDASPDGAGRPRGRSGSRPRIRPGSSTRSSRCRSTSDAAESRAHPERSCRSMAGRAAASWVTTARPLAWLVVQHMDMDLEFQRTSGADARGVSQRRGPAAQSRVLDRPRAHARREAADVRNPGLGVTSAADEARIDANRAALGLEPWRVAVEKRKKDYANGYGELAATPTTASERVP